MYFFSKLVFLLYVLTIKIELTVLRFLNFLKCIIVKGKGNFYLFFVPHFCFGEGYFDPPPFSLCGVFLQDCISLTDVIKFLKISEFVNAQWGLKEIKTFCCTQARDYNFLNLHFSTELMSYKTKFSYGDFLNKSIFKIGNELSYRS